MNDTHKHLIFQTAWTGAFLFFGYTLGSWNSSQFSVWLLPHSLGHFLIFVTLIVWIGTFAAKIFLLTCKNLKTKDKTRLSLDFSLVSLGLLFWIILTMLPLA
ncbi:MAG: hypothetical protein NT098_04505 [Candidatus Parcubacteria bacterium]|nr:hypothetical protein [Candidatus Parcubacteria bacterium]